MNNLILKKILIEEVTNFTNNNIITNLYDLIEFVNTFYNYSYKVRKSSYNDELVIRILLPYSGGEYMRTIKYRTKDFIHDGTEKCVSYRDNIDYLVSIFDKNLRIKKINYLID